MRASDYILVQVVALGQDAASGMVSDSLGQPARVDPDGNVQFTTGGYLTPADRVALVRRIEWPDGVPELLQKAKTRRGYRPLDQPT